MIDTITQSLVHLWTQIVIFVPRVIVAIIIWVVGRFLLNLAVRAIRKIDIKGTEIDNYLTNLLSTTIFVVGKIFLVLIILDYFGVGQNIVAAIANGLTITIAIALGLAFGRALEDDAQAIVNEVKSHLKKKPARR
jgi:small conductance mechanosensitive channel